ncbi:hypothetical protein, partial [Chryseobacterium sp. CH1]|uniref:hypothetical protein n=1 Tax=Chryseobacterium sp. CH1 TaxID=713551 RepID=UPI001026238B
KILYTHLWEGKCYTSTLKEETTYVKIFAPGREVGKPLTLSEKILYTHLWEGKCYTSTLKEETTYVKIFAPGREV